MLPGFPTEEGALGSPPPPIHVTRVSYRGGGPGISPPPYMLPGFLQRRGPWDLSIHVTRVSYRGGGPARFRLLFLREKAWERGYFQVLSLQCIHIMFTCTCTCIYVFMHVVQAILLQFLYFHRVLNKPVSLCISMVEQHSEVHVPEIVNN